MPTTKTTRAIGEMMMVMSKESSTPNKTNDRREERRRERERRLTAYTHLYIDWLAEGNELGWFFALLRIEDCAHDVRARPTSDSSFHHISFFIPAYQLPAPGCFVLLPKRRTEDECARQEKLRQEAPKCLSPQPKK
jgi:hypothetical protein